MITDQLPTELTIDTNRWIKGHLFSSVATRQGDVAICHCAVGFLLDAMGFDPVEDIGFAYQEPDVHEHGSIRQGYKRIALYAFDALYAHADLLHEIMGVNDSLSDDIQGTLTAQFERLGIKLSFTGHRLYPLSVSGWLENAAGYSKYMGSSGE